MLGSGSALRREREGRPGGAGEARARAVTSACHVRPPALGVQNPHELQLGRKSSKGAKGRVIMA